MLRGVKAVGPGARFAAGGRGRAGRRSRALGGVAETILVLAGWLVVLAPVTGHAADPFPPGEASEHFDAQARAGKKDLMAMLQADSRFQVLARALNVAGMSSMLRARGPLTLFVPTDAAFEKLSAGKLDQWLKQPGVLKALLRYHMLRAYVPSRQLTRLRNALTASGYVVTIDGGSGVKVNGAAIIETDMYASNGVIHVIDTVLVPPEAKSKSRRKGKGAAKDVERPADGGEGAEKSP